MMMHIPFFRPIYDGWDEGSPVFANHHEFEISRRTSTTLDYPSLPEHTWTVDRLWPWSQIGFASLAIIARGQSSNRIPNPMCRRFAGVADHGQCSGTVACVAHPIHSFLSLSSNKVWRRWSLYVSIPTEHGLVPL